MLVWHSEEGILYSASVQFVLLKFVRIACLFVFRIQVVLFFNCLEYEDGKPGKVLSLWLYQSCLKRFGPSRCHLSCHMLC